MDVLTAFPVVVSYSHNDSSPVSVLEKYGLEEFKPLVEGLRKGDLRTFQDGLVKYQHLFIR